MKETSYESISRIFSSLEDDESRCIFLHRLNFSLTGDICEIMKIVQETYRYTNSSYLKHKTIDKFIIEYSQKNQKEDESSVIILGSGRVANEVIDVLKLANIPINYMWHESEEDINDEQIPPIEIDDLIALGNRSKIIVAVESFDLRIPLKLIKAGIPNENFIYLRHRELQYFGRPNWIPQENEVFIDAGAMDGETLLFFHKWCSGKYKKIYSFEPDFTNYQKLLKTIVTNELSNIIPYRIGLYKEKNVLNFDSQGNPSSSIQESGTSQINVDRLDSLIPKSERITFIKMDIEGAELDALIGSAEIIKKDKPRLAICIYHKTNDIIDIPELILSLVPEYHFIIRHHAWGRNETVLYGYISD